jgi:hypothetical protein
MFFRKTRNKRHYSKGRGSATRGWKKLSPGVTERRKMLATCGKRCFLGPKMSYPICVRGTCKVDRRGVQSAYNRARQYKRVSVATKAKQILKKMR